MTGYTVHTGSSQAFSDSWDKIFTKKKTKKSVNRKTKAKAKKKKK